MSMHTRSRAAQITGIALFALLSALAFVTVEAKAAYTATSFQLTPSTLDAATHPKIRTLFKADAATADRTGGDDAKTMAAELPAGMALNPAAVAVRCPEASFVADTCAAATQVGTASIKWRDPLGPTITATGKAYLISEVPADGYATVGLVLQSTGWRKLHLRTAVTKLGTARPGTGGEIGATLTTELPRNHKTSTGITRNITVSEFFTDFNPKSGSSQNGAYFTLNPTRCSAAVSRGTVVTYGGSSSAINTSFTPKNCSQVGFTPSAAVTVTDRVLFSPIGLTASFAMSTAGATRQQSHVRSFDTTLPQGTSFNHPAIAAVVPCGDAGFNSGSCPTASTVGTASMTIPTFPAGFSGAIVLISSGGVDVQLGALLRTPSGILYSQRITLTGPDSAGRMHLMASELPQASWSGLSLTLSTKLIRNPGTCGAYSASTRLTAYTAASATIVSNLGTLPCEPDPPTTTITSGPSGIISNPAPTFTFTSNQAASTFDCRVDGAAWAACMSPFVLSPQGNGQHTFCVRATFNGVPDPTPECRDFTVDTAPPVISNVALSQPYQAGPSQLTYTATDNSGSPPTCTPPSGSTIMLVTGPNQITIVCDDAAQNRATYSAVLYITLPSAFTVTITAGPPSQTMTRTPFFDYETNTPVSGMPPCPPGAACVQVIQQLVDFLCTMDGSPVTCGANSNYGGRYQSPALALGSHTFCVRARYLPSGAMSNTDCHSFTVIDETPLPPSVVITSPANNSSTTSPTTNVSFVVAGSSTIPADTVCTVEGVATTSTTDNVVSLAPGANTIDVACFNAYGASTTTVNVERISTGFAPQFNQTMTNPTFDENTALVWDFSVAAGNEAIRELRVEQPVLLQGNYPAFGQPSERCPSSGATSTSFDVSTCPSQARVGTAEFSVPSSSEPLTGDVYLIEMVPIPRIGIDVDGAVPGNNGIDFQAVISTTLLQADPLCDTELDYCPNRLVMTLRTLQNREFSGVHIELGGIDRIGSAGPISGDLFRLTSDVECADTVTTSARFTGHSNTAATVVDNDLVNCVSTPPDVAITGGPSGYVSSTTPSFSFQSIPSGASFECQWDGGAWVPCVPPIIPPPLGQGAHTFCVRATNEIGTSAAACRSFIVDTVAPVVIIASPFNGSTITATSATIVFTVSDASPTTITCRLDGAAPIACTSPWVVTSLSVGAHTFTVCATDAAGNTGCSTVTITRTTPVDTVITSGPNGATSNRTPSFTFTSTGPATFQCNLDGGPWFACTSPMPLSTLAEGSHTFCVRAVGSDGIPDPSPACRTFTVDTVAPVVTIISPASNVSTLPITATWTVVDANPITGTTCSRDGAAASACTSPFSIGMVTDGVHVFTVCATDIAGNTGCSTRTYTYTHGDSLPMITSGPSGTVNSSSASFTTLVPPAGAIQHCSLDGGAWFACTNPINFTGLSNGSHTFCIRWVDAAGNVSAPTCRTWTVDTIPPNVLITAPVGLVATPTITGTFTATDSSGNVSTTCRVDIGVAVPCTSPYTLPFTPFGSHTFTVCATDIAGNVGCATSTFTDAYEDWVTTTITSAPPNPSISTSATFTFAANPASASLWCNLDGSAFSTCASPRTYGPLSLGTHTFCVRAVSAEGATSPATCHTWTITT